jgi:hypothetical protein
MTFLFSAQDGLSQLMGSPVSAGGMSGGISGAERFNNSPKSISSAVSQSMSMSCRFYF